MRNTCVLSVNKRSLVTLINFELKITESRFFSSFFLSASISWSPLRAFFVVLDDVSL